MTAALRYEEWSARNRDIVDARSGGRLGYLHVRHFGTGELERIERAIDSDMRAAEGLVLDVRYNGGGWSAGAVASLLARRATHRGAHGDQVSTASETILGVGVVDRPYALLQNEKCLSNSGSFSEAFCLLGLGPIVGMPTAAWCASPFALVFVGSRAELERRAAAVVPRLADDALLWFAYPKKSSRRYSPDVDRDEGWESLGALGFEGVRIVALDDD